MKVWKNPAVRNWKPRNPEDRNKRGVVRSWVLELINLGATPREVADKLMISMEAVVRHYKTLKVDIRAERAKHAPARPKSIDIPPELEALIQRVVELAKRDAGHGPDVIPAAEIRAKAIRLALRDGLEAMEESLREHLSG